MPRRRDGDDGEEEEYNGGGGEKRRRRSLFVDEDEDGEGVRGSRGKRKRRSGSEFFDLEAVVGSDDDEEEEEEGEDDFIVDGGTDLPDEVDERRMHRGPLRPREDEQEDVEALERSIQERYAKLSHSEYEEEMTYVEQQALLPSVRDPKLWTVKCSVGHEREVVVCLMQKYADRGSELQIRSAFALDHLKGFIYVEAYKEAHVKEACRGLRNIYLVKLSLVPIKEMSDVLSVATKAIYISKDSWIRMKNGIYKGDLGKVVDVDDVRQKVTVKLIPRIDLQALANKLESREVDKKRPFVPPPRFMNIEEVRELHIRVEHRRDPSTGDYYESIGGMMFKDGFLFKTVAMRSVIINTTPPTIDEQEKFRKGKEGGGDMASLSTLFANRKKGHFMKGDVVIVVNGDLKNLMGWVEKVEEENVHIRPKTNNLPRIAVNENDICKYFRPGDHVKVISGAHVGVTGMVVKIKGHKLLLVSDTTKEDICVFAYNVRVISEVATGISRIGNYELHDLVLLDDMSFGAIIHVESEAFKVLKGVPDRVEVALVKLSEIKSKLERKTNAIDRLREVVSVKDVVEIVEGPCKGKRGTVKHIFKGILFIIDHHHLKHSGYICAKAQSCEVVGDHRARGDRNVNALSSRFPSLRASPFRVPPHPRPPISSGGKLRSGRGHDFLVGSAVKICKGSYKGHRGRVKEIKEQFVRVELESQGKDVIVNRDEDSVKGDTPFCDTPRYALGSETPLHPSRTPLHPIMTPTRDSGAFPTHDGMRTPVQDQAWNSSVLMCTPRDNWEDGNPASWKTSLHNQRRPGTPARPYI